MPAAAVIPAPIAYIKVVAVKKLVVGFLVGEVWSAPLLGCEYRSPLRHPLAPCARFGLFRAAHDPRSPSFTLKKLECFKQASLPLNTLAWNNEIGLGFYFVGF